MKWNIVLCLLCLKAFCMGESSNLMDASPADFPYLAIIFDMDGMQFFGGVLITNNFVVTPAIAVNELKDVIVFLGFSKHPILVSDPRLEEGTQAYRSSKIYVHEDFEVIPINNTDSDDSQNNVALVKLQKPVVITDRIRPGKIISKNDLESLEKKLVNVSGWSNTEDANNNGIKFGTGHMLDYKTCKGFPRSEVAKNKQFCFAQDFDVDTLNVAGNAVSVDNKIIGLRDEIIYNCTHKNPMCQRLSGITSLVAYLDWISKKTNVPIAALTSQTQKTVSEISLLTSLLVCCLLMFYTNTCL